MATIDNAFGSGVTYTAAIDLGAQKPLDSRISVNTIAERDEHVTGNRAYEGMLVYVTETELLYLYTNEEWVEVPTAARIINDTTTGGATDIASAETVKDLQEQVDAISAGDLTVPVATTTKVGGILSGTEDTLNNIVVDSDGNATVSYVSEADTWRTARTITLSGDTTGSVSIDGSADVTLSIEVVDDSHNHTIDNIDNLQDELDLKAPLESPALTGTPTAPTAAEGTNTTQIATTAFVSTAINTVLEASAAMTFEGVITSTSGLPTSGYDVGDTYVVGEDGTYAGQVCEVGDMVICVSSYESAYSDDDWVVVQVNINGAVTGPTSAVDSNVAFFDGTSGRVIKDSGFTLPTPSTSNSGDAMFVNSNGVYELRDIEVTDVVGLQDKLDELSDDLDQTIEDLDTTLTGRVETLESDITTKVDRVTDAVEDNVVVFSDDGGQVKDSGIAIDDVLTVDDFILFSCQLSEG